MILSANVAHTLLTDSQFGVNGKIAIKVDNRY